MDIIKTNQQQKAGDNSKQVQQTGDNSNQTIIENQTNNYNLPITEIVPLISTVSLQVEKQALALCTQVSEDICKSKIGEFESRWLPIISKIEGVDKHLKDPKFQFMIRDANISAAKRSRDIDLDILTQLLVCHIEKGDNMIIDAGINKTIQIVNEIDNSSLCGLTCVATMLNYHPRCPMVEDTLRLLNDLFSKLLYTDLPEGDDWIDHLDVLNAINIQSKENGLHSFLSVRNENRNKIVKKYYPTSELMKLFYEKYTCVGIKEGSEEHKKALEIMKENNMDLDLLVPNECLPGYLRLNVDSFDDLFNHKYIYIYKLYSNDHKLHLQSNDKFIKMWKSHETLRKITEWYDKIPIPFRISTVGLVLAQTNGKRCCPDFPDLI
jgi:hypothetical protein